MSNVARQVARDIVSGLAEPGLLIDRAPTRIQSLKRNHVARVDRQRGCQLTGKISVQRPRCRRQVMPCHAVKPFLSTEERAFAGVDEARSEAHTCDGGPA